MGHQEERADCICGAGHFGITSPKAQGVTGDDVAQLFKEKNTKK